MNLREHIVTTLRDGLPATWKIIGYPYEPEKVTGPTVAVWTSSLTRLDAGNAAWDLTYTVHLFTGHESPAKADDALDVLWAANGLLVESAERVVLGVNQNVHAWSLTVRAGVQITEA